MGKVERRNQSRLDRWKRSVGAEARLRRLRIASSDRACSGFDALPCPCRCPLVGQGDSSTQLLEFFASLPACLVGLEASGSAHHWARELIRLGHDARMMPPAYVKPYIRRQKNDASDAAAICEAVTRPSMRFVGVRSLENQATLMRHKTREMLVSQRTQLLNALRGHLTEIGVIAAQGPRHGRELAELIEACDETIPFEVCEALAPLVVQLRNLDEAIARLDRAIATMAQ